MIDHVDEVIPGKSAKGYKNLTLNEWFFPIHFPGNPIMPRTIQLESLEEMLIITVKTLAGNKGKTTRFLSASSIFRKDVFPGEKLVIETKVVSWRRGILKGNGIAYTNSTIACEAEMLIAFPDILDEFLPQKKK
jgi:3-hydroxyacyl-[acyl-carrier-protein] dehydratase